MNYNENNVLRIGHFFRGINQIERSARTEREKK